MSRPPQPGQAEGALDGVAKLGGALVVIGLVLAAAPGLVAGAVIAFALRALRLRWSFGVVIAIALTLPLALDLVGRARLVQALAVGLLDGSAKPDARSSIEVLWPFWLMIAGFLGAAGKHALERRARLHGGRGERELDREVGPLAIVTRQLRRHRATRAPLGTAGGVLLGFSRTGDPVRIPALETHAMIVGGSGSGKTTTAEVLLEGEVAAGRGFVILDGKGGRSLPRFAVDLAARYDRPVALWSVLPYGTDDLDQHRRAWNPAGGGNPTEIKDRIAAAEEQTEPYYAAIAARGLVAAARASRQALDRAPGLDELASLLDSPPRLAALLQAVDPDRHARDVTWLQGLTEGERSGLRGMGTRLFTMVNSDGGEWLLPNAAANEVDLYEAVSNGWLVVFTLPEGTYPALIPHVSRYALAALNAVGTRLEREDRRARSLVFIDELSAFDGDQLCGGLERGRSAGMSYIVASQSVSNFRTVGGEKLLDAILDNSELVLIHRQSAPQAVELLAGVAGTAEGWEHSHVVSDRFARRPFSDESGERTRRLTEQFRAHPNEIKQLAVGEAVLVRKNPRFVVDHVSVRASSTVATPH
jgi:hypothetical protein